MRWRSKLGIVAATGAALSAAVLLFGFILFATGATSAGGDDPPAADGIVVLTGGELRIAEAGRLLAQRLGHRLLVSGVHPRTTEADVRRLTSLPPALFACCVDIDRAALDTHGNAVETRRWAARHEFTSLIVVTASYHMLRSRLELEQALPGVRLYTHPVLPSTLRRSAWWLSPGSVRLLAGEYVKLLAVAARRTVGWTGLRGAPPPVPAPTRRQRDDDVGPHAVTGRLGMAD